MAKTKTIYEGLSITVPSFLYEELKKTLEKDNIKPSPLIIQDTINEAIIFYIQNYKGLEKLKEELNDYKNLCKNSLYNLTYLLAKNIALNLSKEKGEKISLSVLEQKATETAVNASSSLLNENLKDDEENKKRILEEKYYNFKHPPLKDDFFKDITTNDE